MLPKVHTYRSDAGDPTAIARLHLDIIRDFPGLNVLINNAGLMRKINMNDRNQDLSDITLEIETNLSGPIRMVKQFLAHLKTRQDAAIVNISSGLAFIPFPISPVYSAAKAGIHSFTQSLRIQLKNTRVKVFEVAPPGTETPLYSREFTAADVGGAKGMDVKVLVDKIIQGMGKDIPEIRPGLANVLKMMSRAAPEFMLKQLGKSADLMLAETNV